MGDSYRGGSRGGYSGGGSRGGYSGGGRGGSYRGGSRGGGQYGGGGGMDPNIGMPEMARHPLLVNQGLPHGNAGTPIELVANYYKLTTTDIGVNHYDIDIRRDRPDNIGGQQQRRPPGNGSGSSHSSDNGSDESSSLQRFVKKFAPQIVDQWITDHGATIFAGARYMYDGYKNLYTIQQLNMQGKEKLEFKVQIQIDGLPVDFALKLKRVDRLPMGEILEYYQRKKGELSDRTLSVYETLFRFIFGRHYQVFFRKFFDMATISASPKTAIAEFVQGFTSAVRMTEFGLALNLHLKTSCVISRQMVVLADLAFNVASIRPGSELKNSQLNDLNRFIRRLRITTRHTGRPMSYVMECAIDKRPNNFRFKNRDGIEITVAEYFERQYGLQLLDLPLIKTNGRQERHLPMELCYLVPNQFLSNQKINAQIQRELLYKSTHTPNVYFQKLDATVKKIARLEPELLRDFGLQIDTRPVTFTGRVLPTPRQINGDNRAKFYSTKPPPARWAVFCFDGSMSKENLERFVKQLIDRARYYGLNMAPPSPVAVVTIRSDNCIYNAFYNLEKRSQADFVFVGLPTRHEKLLPAHMYSLVKFHCDQAYGILSQCFMSEKAMNLPGGYFDNFLLKVNGKIGGLNAVVDPRTLQEFPFNMERTMFIGIDVNHPSETERIASSVAVALGSTDPMFSAYTASIRVQKRITEEKITCLDEMMDELLAEYRKINETYPENLIIFRDGVSDGNFSTVFKSEIPQIYTSINKTGKPMRFTVIVVQKHHNTRFALAQMNTQTRKPTWNVPSGTVVDNAIVDPLYKMFYLNSHFSPLGTSRPTKYIIIKDDLSMNPDTIQKMCFVVCYNSIRTRGVISIPTPVRYANLCAQRSKVHIEAQRDLIDRGSLHLGKISDIEREIIARLNALVKANPDLKNRLYYC